MFLYNVMLAKVRERGGGEFPSHGYLWDSSSPLERFGTVHSRKKVPKRINVHPVFGVSISRAP